LGFSEENFEILLLTSESSVKICTIHFWSLWPYNRFSIFWIVGGTWHSFGTPLCVLYGSLNVIIGVDMDNILNQPRNREGISLDFIYKRSNKIF
jgi:hypothetical protein